MSKKDIMKCILKKIISLKEEKDMLQNICDMLPNSNNDMRLCYDDKCDITLEYGRFIRIYQYYWDNVISSDIRKEIPELVDIGIIKEDWGC